MSGRALPTARTRAGVAAQPPDVLVLVVGHVAPAVRRVGAVLGPVADRLAELRVVALEAGHALDGAGEGVDRAISVQLVLLGRRSSGTWIAISPLIIDSSMPVSPVGQLRGVSLVRTPRGASPRTSRARGGSTASHCSSSTGLSGAGVPALERLLGASRASSNV